MKDVAGGVAFDSHRCVACCFCGWSCPLGFRALRQRCRAADIEEEQFRTKPLFARDPPLHHHLSRLAFPPEARYIARCARVYKLFFSVTLHKLADEINTTKRQCFPTSWGGLTQKTRLQSTKQQRTPAMPFPSAYANVFFKTIPKSMTPMQ